MGKLKRGHVGYGQLTSNWDIPAFAGAGGYRTWLGFDKTRRVAAVEANSGPRA